MTPTLFQDPSTLGMYPQNMDGNGTPGPAPAQGPAQGPVSGPSPVANSGPTGPAAARGGGPPQGGFRGRPIGTPAIGMRGRGGFAMGSRGRGRGGMFVPDGGSSPFRLLDLLPHQVASHIQLLHQYLFGQLPHYHLVYQLDRETRIDTKTAMGTHLLSMG